MRVEAGGHSLEVVSEGPRGGPAVVFIHGLAASLSVWAEQARALSDSFFTIRYDLRSHGASDATRVECSRHDLAVDLIHVLDGLSIEKAALVGHSGGGVVAMQTAVDFPDRVSALCLVGTASECNDVTAAWYRETAARARAEGGEAAMRAMRMPSGPTPDGAGLACVALAMSSLNQDPLSGPMSSVGVPTLVVVGENDFLGAGGSVILSRLVADSELEIVKGAGHGVHQERSPWFCRRLREFLDKSAFG
ncbi:MAG: alpha/beta hydrolase [Deltaproteobacteria bacterium]